MRYRKVALGGTFDFIHSGHRNLLSKAFEVGQEVIIGLTAESLVRQEVKKGVKTYAKRKQQLIRFLEQAFPRRKFTIRPLKEPLGEIANRADIEAVVVSEETFQRAIDANFIRLQKKLKPLAVFVIPMEKAGDGKRISSTRIRAGEIDMNGRLLKKASKTGTKRSE